MKKIDEAETFEHPSVLLGITFAKMRSLKGESIKFYQNFG